MDPKLEKWTWTFLLISAVGVMVTSTCYALSAEVLALPIPVARIPEALAAASREGAGRILSIGGAFGVAADTLYAAAALVLARHAKGPAALGWSLGAASGIVFTIVDAMAARALQPGEAFAVAKALFDVLFIGGTFAFGVSTLLVFWERRGEVLGKLLIGVGALGTLSSLAALAGAPTGPVVGISIGAGVTLYAVFAALQLWPAPSRALRAT